MTVRLQACFTTLIGPMVGTLTAIPLGVLLLYPLYYLSLSESWRMVADLPQDILLVLLGEAIVSPLFLVGWLWRSRSRYWIVTDDGIEMAERGGQKRRMGWDQVKSLHAQGGTVTLLTREHCRMHRIRAVKPALAASAVEVFKVKTS